MSAHPPTLTSSSGPSVAASATPLTSIDSTTLASLCSKLRRRASSSASGPVAAAAAPPADFALTPSLYRHLVPVLLDLELEPDPSPPAVLNREYLRQFFSRPLGVFSLVGPEPRRAALVDLSPLPSCQELRLRRLDLRHVCLGSYGGGQHDPPSHPLRRHLATLVVTQCRYVVVLVDGELRPPAPASVFGSPWPSLTRLTLTHCASGALAAIDVVLAAAPNLRRLDLSHNQLQLSSPLSLASLGQLTHVSVAYNLLTTLPVFASSVRLHTLLLEHNNLEMLLGLETLTSLSRVDVGWNMLLHHDDLGPVSLLPRLGQLETRGNPIASHPEHRGRALEWLHPQVSVERFLLDGNYLPVRDRAKVGMSRMVPWVPPPTATPRGDGSVVTSSTVSSVREQPALFAGGGDKDGSVASTATATTSTNVKRRRKGTKKVREVVIADEPEVVHDEYHDSAAKKKERRVAEEAAAAMKSKDDLNSSHLETKKRIEELRKTYGEENWLSAVGGDQVHTVLGIAKRDPRSSNVVLAEKLNEAQNKQDDIKRFVAEAARNTKEGVVEDVVENEEIAAESNVVSVAAAAAETEVASKETTAGALSPGAAHSSAMSSSFYSMYSKNPTVGPQGQEEEAEQTEDVLLLNVFCRDQSPSQKLDDKDSSFPHSRRLKITSDTLVELSDSGLVIDRWFTHSIDGCELLSSSPPLLTARITFNTARRDLRERVYRMDEHTWTRLRGVAKPVLEAQTRAALAMGALQCVKCQAEFTRPEETGRDRAKAGQLSCPNCQSTMVIELETTPMPVAETPEVGLQVYEGFQPPTGATPPSTEADVAHSLDEKVFRRQLNQSSTPRKKRAGDEEEEEEEQLYGDGINTNMLASTASIGDANDVLQPPPPPSETSSDISVLSNPSQSSIRVLKSSSDEHIAVGDAADAGADAATSDEPAAAKEPATVKTSALTPMVKKLMIESSSSGSMTDSIVTTQESHDVQDVTMEDTVIEADQTVSVESDTAASAEPDATAFPDQAPGSAAEGIITTEESHKVTLEDEDVKKLKIETSNSPIADSINPTQESHDMQNVTQKEEEDDDDEGGGTVEVAEDVLDQLVADSASAVPSSTATTAATASAATDSGYFSNRPNEWRVGAGEIADAPAKERRSSDSDKDGNGTGGTASSSTTFLTCESDLSLNTSSQFMASANSTLVSGGQHDTSGSQDEDQTIIVSRSSPATPKGGRSASASGSRVGKASHSADDSSASSSPRLLLKRKKQKDVAKKTEMKSDVEASEEKDVVLWDYQDFTKADHRVKLHCELILCKEPDEAILLFAKVEMQIKSRPKIFPGVFVVSNKHLYVLRITRKETTEDPSDWLQLVESRPIAQLCRLVRLISGQGAGLELSSSSSSRSGSGSDATDIYNLLFRDVARTDNYLQQLSQAMLENVRSQPLPVSDLSEQEEGLIREQLKSSSDEPIVLFQLAVLLKGKAATKTDVPAKKDCERVSVIITSEHIFLCMDYFHWLFSESQKNLKIRKSSPIRDISSIELFDNCSERLRLCFSSAAASSSSSAAASSGAAASSATCWDLQLETETSVNGLLAKVKQIWEEGNRPRDLEELTDVAVPCVAHSSSPSSATTESPLTVMTFSEGDESPDDTPTTITNPNSQPATEITFEQFLSSAEDFVQISDRLDDGWKLVQASASSLSYGLVKKTWLPAAGLGGGQDEDDDDDDGQEARMEYHVLYSQSYCVPVLYMLAYKASGRSLTQQELAGALAASRDGDGDNDKAFLASFLAAVSQQSHPFLGLPCWYVHPCKTADVLRSTLFSSTKRKSGSQDNYLASWMSLVGPMFGLRVDPKYMSGL